MRAHFRRVGGVLAGVVLVTGALSAPAQAEPASLSGTLTSEATGEPAQGCALVYTAETYDWVNGSCTDESGRWVVDGLETGVGYKVEFGSQESILRGEWADDAAGFDSASVFTAPATIDAALAYSREVGDEVMTGAITAAETGEPLAGCANLYDAETHDYVDASCSETGQWRIERLAARAYKVHVEAWDGVHVAEYADDARTIDEARPVMAPGHIDSVLDLGAILEGTLSRADGQPAESANVTVYPAESSDHAVAWASTDYDGHWSALVPAGDYKISFHHWLGELQVSHQWAFGQLSEADAAVVTASNAAPTRVDDQMLAAAELAGTITSDSTGDPVDDACVTVFTRQGYEDWFGAGHGCTDESGAYRLAVFAAGDYFAMITDEQGRYLGEFSGDAREVEDAEEFTIARGETTVVDAALADAAHISGRATDARTGEPVAGVCPDAWLGRTGDLASWQSSQCSDEEGRWRIGGLEAGSYAVRLFPSWEDDRHLLTWAFKGTSQATADLITVGAGQDRAVRDVKLGLGGTVTGRITDPAGRPVAGAWISLDGHLLSRAGAGEGRLTAQTDEDGVYVVNGVPAGDYTPSVYGDYGFPWAPEWSGDVTLRSMAEPITVRVAKTARFDASLAPASQVSGALVDAIGEPATGYWTGQVFAADGDRVADLDANEGTLFPTSPLPAGSFTLRLENIETGEVVWYDGATSQADAQRVTLATGEQREITFHLP